jgi:hypothetical protein
LICQGIFYYNRRFFLKMFTKTPSKNYAIAGFPGCPGTAALYSKEKNDTVYPFLSVEILIIDCFSQQL